MENKRNKLLIILNWVIIILWCGFIFWFSSRAGTDSEYDSSSVFDIFLKIFYPPYKGFDFTGQMLFQEKYIYLFRKLAHFVEYAVLGFFAYPAFSMLKSRAARFSSSAVFCVLIAISDEFHQTFVPGRDGKPTDVLIDSVGAIFGIAVTALLIVIVSKIKDKRHKKIQGHSF